MVELNSKQALYAVSGVLDAGLELLHKPMLPIGAAEMALAFRDGVEYTVWTGAPDYIGLRILPIRERQADRLVTVIHLNGSVHPLSEEFNQRVISAVRAAR